MSPVLVAGDEVLGEPGRVVAVRVDLGVEPLDVGHRVPGRQRLPEVGRLLGGLRAGQQRAERRLVGAGHHTEGLVGPVELVGREDVAAVLARAGVLLGGQDHRGQRVDRAHPGARGARRGGQLVQLAGGAGAGALHPPGRREPGVDSRPARSPSRPGRSRPGPGGPAPRRTAAVRGPGCRSSSPSPARSPRCPAGRRPGRGSAGRWWSPPTSRGSPASRARPPSRSRPRAAGWWRSRRGPARPGRRRPPPVRSPWRGPARRSRRRPAPARPAPGRSPPAGGGWRT